MTYRLICSCLLMLVAGHVMAAEPLSASAGSVTMTSYIKVILGLVFVLGLFLLSTWLFKRFGNGPMHSRSQLKIVDGLHISNKERLVLVDFRGRQLLLAISPGRISKIDTFYTDLENNEPAYDMVQANAQQVSN